MYKRNIIVVIILIAMLGIFLEVTRIGIVMKSNKNLSAQEFNIELEGKNIDKKVFDNIENEKYLIIYDSSEDEFIKIKDNVEKTLEYLKKEYITVQANTFNSVNESIDTVIIITSNLAKINDIKGVFKYTFEGGNLFFPYRANPSNNYKEIGINDYGEFTSAYGINFLSDVIIKGKGVDINSNSYENSSYSVNLNSNVEILGKSNNNVPLMWKNKYGKGNIVYFNGTMLSTKSSRGLIVGLLSKLDDNFIYPIINSKVSFIDDFPSPIPDGYNEKISADYNRSIRKFYIDVWWQDMIRIASKYDIIYTGAMIGTYNDETNHIESNSIDLLKEDYTFFVRSLINMNGETGIHGYNHQPLKEDDYIRTELGYKSWKNTAVMVDGLNELNRLNELVLPNYDFSVYVPPSNIISDLGRKALIASNINIKTISSTYNEVVLDEYSQEFEIAHDGIIEFPRISSSYDYTEDLQFDMLSGINLYGLFSHFVHPDDVLDDSRSNGTGWNKMKEDYEKINGEVYDKYPWLRSMSASQGAAELVKYLKVNVKFEKNEESMKIFCDNFIGPVYFILRSEKNIEETENCIAVKIDDNIYLIEVTDTISKIIYER